MPYASVEKRSAAAKRYYAELREKVFDAYGRECLSCGYDEDTRALNIDHIVGNGIKEFKRYSSHDFKRRVLREVNSGLYQMLCANCNMIKGLEARK